jgi:hypothetical protein
MDAFDLLDRAVMYLLADQRAILRRNGKAAAAAA